MNQFNYFNLLPSEIIEFIFKKLNLNNLIKLRIVDRRFKEICEQIKIEQLSVTFDKLNFNYSKFWFYINDPNYLTNENVFTLTKLINYKSIFKLDQHLKRLTIWINYTINISILNEFKLLEQLDFRSKYYQNYDDYKLNLKNLKIAEIELCLSDRLILNTNKLFAFKSNSDLYHYNFNYPDKILFYELNYYYYDNDQIRIFNNLEYLKLIDIDDSIDRDILSKFKNLKILDLYIDIFIDELKFNNLKKDINFIIDEKENLKMYALRIYLQGVELINQNKINQLKWSDDDSNEYELKCELKYNQLEFQLKNYDLLNDNCYKNEINYCDLIKLIGKIPSNFLSKFPMINKVKVYDHINEDQFIKFLNNLPCLCELKLDNCNLSQLFYDNLINFIYLENLLLFPKIALKQNFDFILNFKQLTRFETIQSINNHIQLINKLLKDNLNILIVFYQLNNIYIKIERAYYKRFTIRTYYSKGKLMKLISSFDHLCFDCVILKLIELNNL